MSTNLIECVSKLVMDQVELADDHLVRVEIGPSWPIDAVIGLLHERDNRVKIGILQSLSEHVDDASAIKDPAVLTKMRNRRKKSQNPVPLVLFGSATGHNEAGLQRISLIITRRMIANAWWIALADELGRNFSGGGLVFRRHLAEFVAKRLAAGTVQPEAANGYVEGVVDPNVDPAKLQDRLYEIGLIPDHGLATQAAGGKGAFTRRMDQNQAVLDLLSGLTGDTKKATKVASSTKKSALSLTRWKTSHSSTDLREAELVETLVILGDGKPPPPPKAKVEPFLDALANMERTPAQRTHLLQWASNLLGADGHLKSEVAGQDEDEIGPFELVLSVPPKLDERWLVAHEAPDEDDLSRQPVKQILVRLEVTRAEARKTAYMALRDDEVRKVLKTSHKVLSAFDLYVQARSEVVKTFRLLSCGDVDVLTLLVASPECRRMCDKYTVSWKNLLGAGKAAGGVSSSPSLELLALLDGMWYRNATQNEDGTEAILDWKSEYERAAFAPWHPWRLNSLCRLADEVTSKASLSPEVTGAALWALDQAVPSYRVYQTPESLLEYKATESGCLMFRRDVGNVIPSLSGPPNRMNVAVKAYANTHPWSRAGAILKVMNPPRGGAIKKVVESAAKAFGHQPAVVVIRQDKLSGLDQTDDYANLVRSSNIGASESVEPGGPDCDVIVAFVEGPGARYSGLKQGAFGILRIELLSKGIVAGVGETYVPRLTIGPDEADELIHLPHAISGIDQVQVAEAELVLPTHVVSDLVILARKTGWLLVAVPSTIASFDLPNTDDDEFARIAEFSQGPFRCFLYTSSTGPVIDKIRAEVEKTTLNTPKSVDLVHIVDELVQTQPQKLFEVASSNYGAQEALGIIAAHAIADGWHRKETLRIEISLDDSSWTSNWMRDDGERALTSWWLTCRRIRRVTNQFGFWLPSPRRQELSLKSLTYQSSPSPRPQSRWTPPAANS